VAALLAPPTAAADAPTCWSGSACSSSPVVSRWQLVLLVVLRHWVITALVIRAKVEQSQWQPAAAQTRITMMALRDIQQPPPTVLALMMLRWQRPPRRRRQVMMSRVMWACWGICQPWSLPEGSSRQQLQGGVMISSEWPWLIITRHQGKQGRLMLTSTLDVTYIPPAHGAWPSHQAP